MTSFPDSHRDLLDAEVASLATIGDDGFPQSTELWFLHEDGELKISLNTTRLKTRNLRKRPQCSLLLLDLKNPYRYLEVRGRARIQPDDDYAFADIVYTWDAASHSSKLGPASFAPGFGSAAPSA
jgi:PPOX class probable F420-dependent enzyme